MTNVQRRRAAACPAENRDFLFAANPAEAAKSVAGYEIAVIR
jgi:hypothetical protein